MSLDKFIANQLWKKVFVVILLFVLFINLFENILSNKIFGTKHFLFTSSISEFPCNSKKHFFNKKSGNISETEQEFCFDQSNLFQQYNLNASKFFGFPFVSNKIDIVRGYTNVFRHLADWTYSPENESIIVEDVKCGDIIFVKSHFVTHFFETYHLKIKTKYILITHESDYPAGYPFHLQYLDDKNIVRWFGQNMITRHPKIESIPIGIMSFSREELFKPLYEVVQNIVPFYQRQNLLYLNFSPYTNKHRANTTEYFKTTFKNNSKVVIDETKMNWKEFLLKIGNSQFVLSPPGAGIDCLRTWEALAMGSVPIVLKSELQPMYDEMPVMVVENWSEVTEENMKKFQQQKLLNFSADGIGGQNYGYGIG